MSELPVFELDDLETAAPFAVASFDVDDAARLGTIALEVIREHGWSLAIDIVLGETLVFRAMTGETGEGNVRWLAGKAAVARHYGVPSLLAKRRLEAAGRTVTDDGLDADSHPAYGGAIPILVGGDVIGTVTASGEPDVVDHAAAAEAVRRFLATT